MDLKEKEIELLESSVEKFKLKKKKLDVASSTLMISAIILFSTSAPDSIIKLAFLGLQLESLHAVYLLFISSIITASSYVLLIAKNILVKHRYQILLEEYFGELPESLSLIDSDEYEIRKLIFSGRLNLVNRAYHLLVTLPFFLSYFYMAYQLITFSKDNIFETVSSFLIVVFGLYLFALLIRTSYIKWETMNALSTAGLSKG